MEVIGNVFWSLVLFGIIIVCFGAMAGVKTEGLIRTYLNLMVKILEVIGELLVKLAIPLLKQIGEKIVYVTEHYLQTHPTPKPPQIQNNQQPPINGETPVVVDVPPYAPPKDQPKKGPSANPYDDPPKPEIMD
jgi:hypothetical protein